MPDGNAPLAQPRGEPETLRRIFENPKIVKKLQSTVPRHLNPERMLRVFSLAIQKTPDLAECDPITLLGAMMVCASLGLEPNTPLGHAYLIPFNRRTKVGQAWNSVKDVNLIIGYKGYIDLARRSGTLVSLHADVAYGTAGNLPADEFSFEYGTGMHLRHVPIGDNDGRPPLWAYAYASLKDGHAFEVLPYDRVLRIRNGSQGYQAALAAREKYGADARAWATAPWVVYEHEMASKTMIRRLSKMLPMSIEFANAATLDAMSETGAVDFSAFADGADMSIVDVEAEASADGGQPRQAQIEQSDERPMDTGVTQGGERREAVATNAQGGANGAPDNTASQQRRAAPDQRAGAELFE